VVEVRTGAGFEPTYNGRHASVQYKIIVTFNHVVKTQLAQTIKMIKARGEDHMASAPVGGAPEQPSQMMLGDP